MLSEHDLLSIDPKNMDVERVKKDFDEFLQNYPAPTDEELHQLQELTEAIGNAWIKGNAEFAYNRVMEVSAKFQHYTKLLDSVMEEKRRQRDEAKLVKKKQHQQTESTDGERDGALLDTKAMPHSISDVCLQSTHQDLEGKQSLLYDDTGVDHALLLLDGATRSVNKLTLPTSPTTDSGTYIYFVVYMCMTHMCVHYVYMHVYDSGTCVHVLCTCIREQGAGDLGGRSHQFVV